MPKQVRGKRKMNVSQPVNGTAAKVTSNVRVMPVSDIHADLKWNARSGDWMKASGGSGEGSEFGDFMQSIEARGQDVPVIVRPSKTRSGKFDLVAGFRRFAAVKAIAEKGGLIPGMPEFSAAHPTIRVEVRELTDVEARALNLRENTARDNLRGADLCFGIGQLHETGMSGNAIAAELGKNQSYTNKLLNIYVKAQSYAKEWREKSLNIPYPEMYKLSQAETAEEKQKIWKDLTTPKEKEGKAKAGEGWLEAAKSKAKHVGHILGTLHREEYIDTNGLRFSERLVRTVVKFRGADGDEKEATQKEVDSIVDAMRLAYQGARDKVEEPEEAETAEIKPAKAAKKAAKK